ncbi:triosephosphate isomerase [Candidatus Parcubacteria bacterium]|nr:MAG: triosephosphate isomerase [Candidatus Parcubacteria bacterium]
MMKGYTMRRKLLVANWKLYVSSPAEAQRLAQDSNVAGVVLCPPFPFLSLVAGAAPRAALGAQDVFWEQEGAYTGEVSGVMLRRIGVRYVVVGHSERRALFAEDDRVVRKKLAAALAAKLAPILCVGEPKKVWRRGMLASWKFVRAQLARALRGLPLARKGLLVAYEPIWAIGGKGSDDPSRSAEMAKRIMRTFPQVTRVLYGGSITSRNVRAFLAREEIGGALVGGASARSAEWRRILAQVGKVGGS